MTELATAVKRRSGRRTALTSLLVLGALCAGAFAASPEGGEGSDGWSFDHVLRGLVGVAALVGLAWAMSWNRRLFPMKLVIAAVAMQIVLGLFLIRWDVGYGFFAAISSAITRLLEFTREGAVFVFGEIAADPVRNGPGLAFTALPTIIFFSCLMAVLYHLRVMHVLIWAMAKVMNRLLGVTGAEATAMAANVFVGQTEAPLVIRRFVPTMTRSELMSLMVGGFATVAGSVLAAYIAFLTEAGGAEYVPHLLIASVMSAPAAFAISKVILPETEVSETGAGMSLRFEPAAENVLDAAATGTAEGVKLWLNVFAMLLAFIALVALIDWPLENLGEAIQNDMRAATGWPLVFELSLSRVFGWLFAPLAWLMGVESADCSAFGALLGIKVGVNEFLAYLGLQSEVAANIAGEPGAMSRRSLFMATYALCGFANFSSIGIQIGGITPLAPERRGEITRIALRAMAGGALASWMTASIAGMFF